jgi:hypothetical protein
MEGHKDGWLARRKGNKRRLGHAKPVRPPGELETALAKVRAAAPPPPEDDPIYKYLQSVYRLRWQVEHSPDLQAAIKSEHEVRFPKTKTSYTGVIISLTAPHVTSKMKHKYVTTIGYALRQGVKPGNFIDFVKEHGGINKCCELWTAQ